MGISRARSLRRSSDPSRLCIPREFSVMVEVSCSIISLRVSLPSLDSSNVHMSPVASDGSSTRVCRRFLPKKSNRIRSISTFTFRNVVNKLSCEKHSPAVEYGRVSASTLTHGKALSAMKPESTSRLSSALSHSALRLFLVFSRLECFLHAFWIVFEAFKISRSCCLFTRSAWTCARVLCVPDGVEDDFGEEKLAHAFGLRPERLTCRAFLEVPVNDFCIVEVAGSRCSTSRCLSFRSSWELPGEHSQNSVAAGVAFPEWRSTRS